MSKAFTSEDSGVPEPPLRRDARLKPGARYFTPEGFDALRARAHRDGLEALLASAVVVNPEAGATQIAFGTWVDLEDDHGREVRYRLVGPDEADPKTGQLSVESPLAVALLGKTAGDEVQVELPKGPRTYLVKRIRV